MLTRYNEQNGLHRSAGRRWAASPEVRASSDGNGLVLLHISAGLIYTSNATGARIWGAVLGGRHPREAALELAREGGVSPRLAYRHVLRYLKALEGHGLVTQEFGHA